MRLRLSIRRHALPAVEILWNTGDEKTSSTTVAQFLEQVNEIVPLEAEQWGFEDYVVEITGYECLHFQKLENVCRDEDVVSIRPLQTSEVRARTLSGRYQISSDGKHLIDGIAFGRSYLRRPDRPPIKIPPRKRRRVTHSNDDEDEPLTIKEATVSQGGVLSTTFGHMERTEEYGNLLEFQRRSEHDDGPGEPSRKRKRVQFEDGRVNGGLEAEEDDEDFVPGRSKAKRRAIATIDGGARPRTRSAEQPRNNGRQGLELLSLASDEEDEIDENFDIGTDSNSSTSDSSEHSTDEMTEARSEEDEEIVNMSSDSDSSEDTSSFDDASDSDSSEGTNVEIEKLISVRKSKARGSISDLGSSETTSVSTASSESTSSSSDDEESSSQEEASSEGEVPSERDDSSSEDGPSEDEEPEEITSRFTNDQRSTLHNVDVLRADLQKGLDAVRLAMYRPATSEAGKQYFQATEDRASWECTNNSRKKKTHKLSKPLRNSVSLKNVLSKHNQERSNDLSSSDAPVQAETATGTESTGSSDTKWQSSSAVSSRPKTVRAFVPPYHGKTATKSRNQRRKAAKKLNYFKKLNVLPPDATLEDLKKYSKPEEEMGDSDAHVGRTEKSSQEVNFEARRQALLAAIASGGVEITRNRPDMIMNDAIDDNVVNIAVDMPAAGGSNDAAVNDGQNEGSERETAVNEPLLGGTDENEARKKRRMKLDVAGSRRLLFGSLGLRTPKTHEDSEKLRSRLMEQAKSKKYSTAIATTTDTAVSVTGADTLEEDAEGDLDAWKCKIKLTAVECCDDHVQLSTPPFPFYQRWDPQQQNYPCGPSGKKRKRNSKKYYQGGQAETYEPYEPEYEEDEHVTLNYDDYEDERLPGADAGETFDDHKYDEDEMVDDQLMQEIDSAAAHETDDMPPLPEDMSTLPALQAADVKVGSVIAFKQLEVSAATQWSPKISDYRTARIEDMSDSTGELHLTLAKRDRPQKEVDEEGNRVYEKFEMAGYESEEAEDDGVVAVQLHDLVEPKLVAAADRDGGSIETLAAEDVVVRDEHGDEVGGSEGAVGESAGAEYRINDFVKQEDLAEEARADVTLGADEEGEPSGFTPPMSTALETHREDLQRVGTSA
ncbi:hypothetical protein B0A49_03841 [Cryomyces minteri]|uniref:Coilin n=1 Tax=Cryomyces minteri TaxID=331657 RepID=A0A4V5NG84_9PEZI|nr:hypothetical protein B0A49_03841 [Cryomyces minteri]